MVAAFLLWRAKTFFSILNDQWLLQLCYFGLGITIGSLIYSGRLRFITSFGVLILTFFIAYRFIDNISVGEFDTFFLSKKFLVFSFLFSVGVFMGWGLQRFTYFSIIVAAWFFLLSIYLLSKTGDFTMDNILFILVPIIFYSIYIIFAANELHRFKQSRTFAWGKLTKRLLLFFLFFILVSGSVLLLMKAQIRDTIEQYGSPKANDDNSMLKKNKDGTVQNQDKMGMKKNNKRSNELVFCAYIDNYFDGTEMPNPLYLTSHYFTKFDTLTETFERDPVMPFKDEFTPNPDEIPLFSKKTNKGVLDSSMAKKMIKEVEISVYKKKLAADAFVAPNTAFEVQPITIEKDFQDEYVYAYRAKSKVSRLNSAYFIYNSDDPMISGFQEQRFDELRKATGYQKTDERFLKYYTFFPKGRKYKLFQELADSLSKNNKKTIDKVIAIRSYFKQKNPLGEAVYEYSDNPGIPGLPGASKITNFMFKTKKGWCTYYAGSTLLLLRAMKIPSRIAVGFLTVDRSDKNRGWYWYYQDQAHAWVQVYFPEYGWLDFDMTISNDEARESKTPDGTPPLQPPKAIVVASGEIKKLDSNKNNIQIQANHFIYKEKEYKNINKQISLNLDKAKIWKDSALIQLRDMKVDEYIVGVSYDEKLSVFSNNNIDQVIVKLPSPIPADEVYLKTKKPKDDKVISEENENTNSLQTSLLRLAGLLLLITLFIFSLPYLVLKIYALRFKRSKNIKEQSYRLFRYSTYYLNQLGYPQQKLTLNEFALKVVNPSFGNNYQRFAAYHQQIKYSSKSPTVSDENYLPSYFSSFTSNIKQKTTFKQRFKSFLNLSRTFEYFLSYSNN
jgi:hypothetical protein